MIKPIRTGDLIRSYAPRRIVQGESIFAEPGQGLQLLEIYPTREALDFQEALESLGGDYTEMWEAEL